MIFFKYIPLLFMLLISFLFSPEISELKINPQKIKQGEPYVVHLALLRKAKKVTLEVFNREQTLFPYPATPTNNFSREWEAVLAVPANAKPQEMLATINIMSTWGFKRSYSTTLNVAKRRFKWTTLWITPKLRKIISRRETKENRIALQKSQSILSPEKKYKGKFRLPVRGRISSLWGERRVRRTETYKSSPRIHWGIDLSAPKNTKVYACASGDVVFARHLIKSGKTIIINHGQGIFSKYYHLNRIQVKEGQSVTRGKLIGRVGSTGFSTGPHLHWQVDIQRIPVNPLAFR